jgi:uncharacterized membrane protein
MNLARISHEELERSVNSNAHLWAVGFEDMDRAAQVRAELAKLGECHCLDLLDTAVAVCYPDGSFTVDGEPFVPCRQLTGQPSASFLSWLALGAPPLTGTAVCALVGRRGGDPDVGIDDKFIYEVRRLMGPETSALFVLDRVGDLPAILNRIQGLGGTVLKTNVYLERAKLIQSTLSGEFRP